jgi:hypothetical protein
MQVETNGASTPFLHVSSSFKRFPSTIRFSKPLVFRNVCPARRTLVTTVDFDYNLLILHRFGQKQEVFGRGFPKTCARRSDISHFATLRSAKPIPLNGIFDGKLFRRSISFAMTESP